MVDLVGATNAPLRRKRKSMSKIEAGTIVTLEVEREAPFGVFLTNGSEDVLLHESEIIGEIEVGEDVEVFLYHDKQERITATMKKPNIQKGRYGWAQVVGVQRHLGIFVDIGISTDLLVSLDDLSALEHLWPEVGDWLYVSIKTDRKGRLLGRLATENIMEQVARKAPKTAYNSDITGNVYRLMKIGSFMISEEGYRCFIHESERKREPRLGERVSGRVIDVKEDGTLNVSLFPRKQDKMSDDAEEILAYMEGRNGAMPYSDKSHPDDILEQFGMSKGAFKRALGGLMKQKKVYQEDGWTYITKS